MASKDAIAAELKRQELLAQCHGLVARIGQRPNSIKLLMGAKQALEVFANYKQGRWQRQRSG